MQLYRVLEKQSQLEHNLKCITKVQTYISKIQTSDFKEELEVLDDLILNYQTELSKINDSLSKVEVDIPLH